MDHICFNCMSELQHHTNSCPVCGFSNTTYDVKSHHLLPGTMLRDRYIIGKVLGEGGFGITYVGWDTLFDTKVAIKEFYMTGYVGRINTFSLDVQISTGNFAEIFEKNRARFLDEAKVLAKFHREPSIVSVLDYFQSNNTAYIVMDFIQGETLKNYLQRKQKLSWQETRNIMRPVLEALRLVHTAHIIHRDVSPDNIMITQDGHVKLLDFGAARQVAQGNAKSLSIILKPGYAPQEQYRTKGEQGPWTDVYAVCATMYRCLTGVVPEESMERLVCDGLKAPSELCECTSHISKVLMKGLAVQTKDRWQSVDSLILAIENEEPLFSADISEKPIQCENDDNHTILLGTNLQNTNEQTLSTIEKSQVQSKDSNRLERKTKLIIAVVGCLALVLCAMMSVIFFGNKKTQDALEPTEMLKTDQEDAKISADEYEQTEEDSEFAVGESPAPSIKTIVVGTTAVLTTEEPEIQLYIPDAEGTIEWHSSNPMIASVRSDGVVMGLSGGYSSSGKTIQIIACYKGLEVSTDVISYVNREKPEYIPSSWDIKPVENDITVKKDSMAQIELSPKYEDCFVEYRSEKENIVEVDEKGNVYGKTTGTTRISVTVYNGYDSATHYINVICEPNDSYMMTPVRPN